MASSTPDSFDQLGVDSPPAATTRPFDNDGYLGYDPRLPSQRFDFAESESAADDSPILTPPPIYASAGGFSPDPAEFSPEANGNAFEEGYLAADGPILPPPAEMEHEEGFALREWRSQNAIRLEEKEKREKELLSQILDEAEEYKVDFYSRRKVSCEANKGSNREKEKLFLASHEKFHAEADKNYWKTIADLVPNEVPVIAKRGKKEQEKQQPSIVVIQGPKPGKPTDLARMRQILIKLKHNTPPHLKPSPPTKDAKTGGDGTAASTSAPPKAVALATPVDAVAVA